MKRTALPERLGVGDTFSCYSFLFFLSPFSLSLIVFLGAPSGRVGWHGWGALILEHFYSSAGKADVRLTRSVLWALSELVKVFFEEADFIYERILPIQPPHAQEFPRKNAIKEYTHGALLYCVFDEGAPEEWRRTSPMSRQGPAALPPFHCEHYRLSLVAGFTSALPGLPGLYRPARRYLNRRAGRPRAGGQRYACTYVQYGAFAQAGKAGNLASLRRRLAGWVEM